MSHTSLKLSDVYRTQFVKRWHILNTPRTQTVAEHSYLVAMISLDLCNRLGIEDDETINKILIWSLIHDLPEVVMGDPVSPVKNVAREAFDNLEDDIDPARSDFFCTLGKLEVSIVKLADYIDAVKFLSEEGINGQSKVVREKLHRNMTKFIITMNKELPNFKWSEGHSCLLEYIHGKQTFIDEIMP